MIPKTIHYCWFGRGKMPALAEKCIASWKKYLPDYTIKEWNEDNFDLDSYPYVREAYDNRKFAFVTDVVRLYALYNEGGIYMDTDVEVLKSLDPFLDNPAFSGFEDEENITTGIMAAEKRSIWAKGNLEYYNDRHFILPDGSLDTTTNVATITAYMLRHGLRRNDTLQRFSGLVTIYPHDFFCPMSHLDSKIRLTKNSATIHYFSGSWLEHRTRYRIKNFILYRILGKKLAKRGSRIKQWLLRTTGLKKA